MKCCLCGEEITPEPVTGWEYGCNPYPLATDGKCCWKCDRDRVFPARLKLHHERRNANPNTEKARGE